MILRIAGYASQSQPLTYEVMIDIRLYLGHWSHFDTGCFDCFFFEPVVNWIYLASTSLFESWSFSFFLLLHLITGVTVTSMLVYMLH